MSTQEIEVLWSLEGDRKERGRRLIVNFSDFEGCFTKKQVSERLAQVILYEIQALKYSCNRAAYAEDILFALEEKRLMEGEAA